VPHLIFANPLYGIPHLSLILACTMAVVSLGAMCMNAWRNLRYFDEEDYGKELDSGVNVLVYGIAFVLYALTTAFLHYHVHGMITVILGFILILYSCAVLDDSTESDSMPFGDVALIFVMGFNLASHLWEQDATRGWWTSLIPALEDVQSLTLWLGEIAIAGLIICALVNVAKMCHSATGDKKFSRGKLGL